MGGLFVYRFVSPLRASSAPGPPATPQAVGVVTGAGVLSKSAFAQDGRVGTVTEIAMGEFDPSPGTEIGVAGSRGALFLDEQGNVKSAVTFSAPADHVDIIDADNDGICEFMNRGGPGVPPSVIDHQGTAVWTYAGPTANDMAAGDIDGDGKLEYAVGCSASVHLLETDGTRVWQKPDDGVSHVELVDADADGSLEIVHSSAGGEMKLRDRDGNIMSRVPFAAASVAFSLCAWPGRGWPQHALVSADATIWIGALDGRIANALAAPQCGKGGHARGITARLKSGPSEYAAVVVGFPNQDRAIVYVYDPNGTLVYHEVLPEPCPSIAAVSLGDSETEVLLVGGEGKVYQYELASGE
jgi:hypothetical protein